MAKWPGTPVQQDEAYGNKRLLDMGQAQQQPAPVTGEQFPGAPIEAPQGAPQQFPGEQFRQEGDIGFGDPSAMEANSRPEGSDQWIAEVNAGITSGEITTPRQVEEIAAKYGFAFDAKTRGELQGMFDALGKGAKFGGTQPLEYPTKPIEELRQDAVLPEQADAVARGVAGIFGIDDEIDAIATWAAKGGKFSERLADSRAIRDYDEQNNYWERLGGELVGGITLGATLPSRLNEVAKHAATQAMRMGLGREAAMQAARRAVVVQSAKEGGAFGAASGFGETDGNIGDRALGALGGATAGGATGGILGSIGNRIAQRGMRRAEDAASPTDEFLDAAQAQGVDFLPADLPKAYGSQFATALTNSTLGAIPITEGAERAVGSLASAKANVAAGMGRIADETGAGQAIQRGLNRFAEDDSRVTQLYDAIPIKSDQLASTFNTKAALAEITEGMKSNRVLSKIWTGHPRLRATLDALTPEISAADRLANAKAAVGDAEKRVAAANAALANPAERRATQQELSDASKLLDEAQFLADAERRGVATGKPEKGEISWDDLRRLRSIVGEIIGKPSLASEGAEDAAMRRFYGALSEDLRATAEKQGPAALKAFERANSYARARANRIERVIKPILGDKYENAPEDSMRVLKSWSKAKGGDFASVAQAFRSLPENEASTVRASIFDAMGAASKGRQDKSGEVFSPADFMTHWNDISGRAKSVLFTPEHRRAVDQIVTLAEGMKASAKYANTSKTGIAVGGASTAGSLMANPILGTLYIAGQFGTGKLLGSPRFAKWLASFGRKPNESAFRDHVKRLTVVARAEPAIAGDVLNLQRRLTEAFSPARLAADEAPDDGGRVVGEDGEQ